MTNKELKEMLERQSGEIEWLKNLMNKAFDSMKATNTLLRELIDMLENEPTFEFLIHPEKRGIKDSIEMGD